MHILYGNSTGYGMSNFLLFQTPEQFDLRSGYGRCLTFIVFVPKTTEERLKDIDRFLKDVECFICKLRGEQ